MFINDKIHLMCIITVILLFGLKIAHTAEYVEVPFQRYSVVFSKPRLLRSDQDLQQDQSFMSMTLFGKSFQCRLPSQEDIKLNRQSKVYDLIGVRERINNMPYVLLKDEAWTFILGVDTIYQISTHTYFSYIIGKLYEDVLLEKTVQGMDDIGEHTFYIRKFANGIACNMQGDTMSADVRFICWQSTDDQIVHVRKTSPCTYDILVKTPRVCSGRGFEGVDGHAIECLTSVSDPNELVTENHRSLQEQRRSVQKDSLDIPLDEGYSEGMSSDDMERYGRKGRFRAEEMLSFVMGEILDVSINPKNSTGKVEFFYLPTRKYKDYVLFRSGLPYDTNPDELLTKANMLSTANMRSKNKKKKSKDLK